MSYDKTLEYLVQQLEKTGVGFSITLCVKGLVIQGNMINSTRYYDLMQDIINPKNIMRQDQEFTQDPNEIEIWNNYYENYKQFMRNMRRKESISGDDTENLVEYIHLEHARIVLSTSTNTVPLPTSIWRGKISSIDGFSIGFVNFNVDKTDSNSN